MFNEKIKALRTRKGMSQESLAQQLHVVRQTISKWEKGLSVPDTDMLRRMAELFEVSVGELLDEPIEEKDVKEIAIQLALLNQQITARNRRWRKFFVGVLIGLPVAFVLYLLLLISVRMFQVPENLTTVELSCTLDGEVYSYEITYDDQYRIHIAGGDAWIANRVQVERYNDATVLIAQIEDFFYLRGGEVEVTVVEETNTQREVQSQKVIE